MIVITDYSIYTQLLDATANLHQSQEVGESWHLSSMVYQRIQCDCEEGVSLQIYSNGRTINVIVIYRPPDCDTEQNQLILKEIIKTTTHKRIIVGDFNLPDIDWITSTAHSTFSRDFLSTVQENGFYQLVSESTRSRGNQSSLLDLVIVSDEKMVRDIQYQEPIAKSDHSVILFNVISMKSKTTSRPVVYHDYGTLYDDHLSLYLNSSTIESMDNIDDMWNYFQCGMKSAINRFVPVRVFVKRNRVNLPRKLISLMRRKKSLWNSYRRGLATYDEYKRTRNQYVSELRKHHRKTTDLALSSSNPKLFYRHMKNILSNPVTIPEIRVDGEKLTSLDACEEFGKFFASTFEKHQEEFVINPTSQEITVITEGEVITAIDTLKLNKPSGSDGIHPIIIHNCRQTLIPILKCIFNQSLKETRCPAEWKHAVVTPIFKNGNRFDVENYRPISITSVLSKIMEIIIRNRIEEQFVMRGIVDNGQYGFTPKRSCFLNLLISTTKWLSAINEGQCVDIIYFDLQKAFDKIPHHILLNNLHIFGIPNSEVLWIKDWLSNRNMNVRIGDEMSLDYLVTSGVPQGSILGPFLFRFHMFGQPSLERSELMKFADDCKLYSIFNLNDTGAIEAIQRDIDALVNWVTMDLKMKLNGSKTKVIHLGHNNPKVTYYVNGVPITATDHHNDLGVIMVIDLKFKKHHHMMCSNAMRTLGMIKKTFGQLTSKQFLHVYKTYIRPKIEYAISIAAPFGETQKALIENVQKRSLKLVRWTRREKEIIGSMSYEDCLKYLNLTTLRVRRLRGDLIEMYKLFHEYYDFDPFTIFELKRESRTRSNHHLCLEVQNTRLEVVRRSFKHRVVKYWNRLTEDIINANSLNMFKNKLDEYLYTLNMTTLDIY